MTGEGVSFSREGGMGGGFKNVYKHKEPLSSGLVESALLLMQYGFCPISLS